MSCRFARLLLTALIFPLLSVVAACQSPRPAVDPDHLIQGDRGYDYPFVDAFAATVVGTPIGYKADVPKDVPISRHRLRVFDDRKLPVVFWYDRGLNYSLAKQRGPAPLAFVIAGTGSSDNSANARLIQRTLFAAGLHVITLPSPTHSNFIRNASTTGVPGRIGDDARDIYRVMRMAYAEVKDRVDVTGFHLAGYSLGAWQAAFVSKLDETEQAFDFGKVLLINPPVSLYNSIEILDRLAEDNIDGGLDSFSDYFERVFEGFAEIYVESDRIDFSPDFLYRVYLREEPKEADLAALVGTAFRVSASDMIFTADVMTDFGFIVPRNRPLGRTSSLTDYSLVGVRVGFINYFDHFYFPYFRAKEPGLTRDALIQEASLKSIESYLRATPKLGLIHNEDDVIMAPGEVEYLAEVFGDRATIYPTGGHMGNLEHYSVVARIVRYFRE